MKLSDYRKYHMVNNLATRNVIATRGTYKKCENWQTLALFIRIDAFYP
jgi:hypothetical protein